MHAGPNTSLVVAIVCSLIVLGPVAGVVSGGDGGEEPPCSPPVVCEISASGHAAAPPPPWYTQAIHEKVLQARERGLGYNAAIDQFVPVNVSFIRPGAWMVWPMWCTMGFVTGPQKILTAGHCMEWTSDPIRRSVLGVSVEIDLDGEIREVEREFINPSTDTTVVLAAGSEKAPDVYVGIGTARRPDHSVDYAVVDIDANWTSNVDPTVEKVFGPDGPAHDGSYGMDGETPVSRTNPLVVKFVGHGAGVGSGGMPRTGLVTRVDFDQGVALCHCPVFRGDSGGPVGVVTSEHAFGRPLGIIERGAPEACLMYTDEPESRTRWCASITLLSEIPEEVMAQRVPDPQACQGEFRLGFTSDLAPITEPDVQDLAVPYVMLYNDQNHNNRMDQGERFENKVSEAWHISQYFLNRFPPEGPMAASSSSNGPEWSTTQSFRSCS